ncbi:MAG: hypothetical protein GTO24_20810 [candidate division Zixibacteria bacterium]|nr:hypothetical protein [candidate division Zixibacteria bacterium]
MILDETKNLRCGKGELRKFGITVGIVFGLLGGLLVWGGKNDFYLCFAVSFCLLAAGSFMPLLLKPVYRVWMAFAAIMGWIMTRVVLGMLFYLVLTPIGLAFRLFRRDILSQKSDRDSQSYWIPRTWKEFDRKKYEYQF